VQKKLTRNLGRVKVSWLGTWRWFGNVICRINKVNLCQATQVNSAWPSLRG